jgi:hypothetical protein
MIHANRYSAEEIADKAGISDEYLLDLLSGNRSDPLHQLFAQELHKVQRKVETRTETLRIQTKELLYKKLNAWIKMQKTTQGIDTKTKHKMLVDSINALSKAPQVQIESYTWKQGMSPEEAINEFRRLSGMAERSTVRRRLSEDELRGSEPLAVRDRSANAIPEDTQDPILPAEPEADEVAPEQGSRKGDIRGKQVREDDSGSN